MTEPAENQGGTTDPALLAAGLELLAQLNKACKLLRLYPEGNARVEEALRALAGLLEEVFRSRQSFAVGCREGKLFIEGMFADEAAGAALSMREQLEAFHVESLRFSPPVLPAALGRLARLFAMRPADALEGGKIKAKLLEGLDGIAVGQVRVAFVNEAEEGLLRRVLPDLFSGKIRIEARQDVIALPKEALDALVESLAGCVAGAMDKYRAGGDSERVSSTVRQCFAVAMPLFMNHGLGDVGKLAARILAPLGEDGLELALGQRLTLEEGVGAVLRTLPSATRSEMFLDDVAAAPAARAGVDEALHSLFKDDEIASLVKLAGDRTARGEDGSRVFGRIMEALLADVAAPAPLAMFLLPPGEDGRQLAQALGGRGVSAVFPEGYAKLEPYFAAFKPPFLWLAAEGLEAGQVPPLLESLRRHSAEAFIMLHHAGEPPLRRSDEKRFAPCGQEGSMVSVARMAEAALKALGRAREDRGEGGRELEQARQIQLSLLPVGLPEVAGLRVARFYEPCGSVGGDYYDALAAPDGRVFFVVADVAGKGQPAAMLAALFRGVFHTLVAQGLPTAELLRRLNDALLSSTRPGMYVTAVILERDAGGELTCYRAGHAPPVLVRRDGECAPIKGKGTALGIAPGEDFIRLTPGEPVRLALGEALFLYTDGVTEAENRARSEFGPSRLCSALRAGAALPPEEALRKVLREIEAFEDGSPRRDDITMLLARRE